jgi:DUF1365 family protein
MNAPEITLQRPGIEGGKQSSRSCIYRGQISHRRFTPASNRFSYALHMLYLDLAELPGLFDPYSLWSARGPAPAWFRRQDHMGDPASPLDESVRQLVERETGQRPSGPICLLTHLRYFGYFFSPISIYYCFDSAGALNSTVLEVSNTPWKERHCYVLSAEQDQPLQKHEFAKSFHVSPFMSMDMHYRCRLRPPGERLNFALENWRGDRKLFDAHLDLRQEAITAASLRRTLIRDPLMTLRVTSLIHWQAFKLWRKRVPFHAHPAKRDIASADRVRPHER